MKVLVCISNVPDTTTKVGFSDNNTKFNTQGVQFIINPYDELALTRALEITEKQGGTVTVVNVGLADTEPSIRKALAIGATDAVRINAEPVDAYFVAEQIANYAKNEGFDFILTGRESIDYNGGMVAGLLGEMLGMPSINVITSIEIENGIAHLERDIDGGREKLDCSLPFVAAAQKELTEPRIPNMRGIMAARTKPLKVVEPTGTEAPTKSISFELPAPKGACKLIDAANAGELISLLHNEAKVI
ncbi:MAG: electron transfer flavoprotein subunit beta/FixA family protein [Bacteroidia bacterium]|jgi:electron transfer flavoprotein beta subunit|nr:electron transfer flavoprotein subunit beta/FixA family protein [Bacteroidia bacterium]MCF8427762.1 electron transfer flavoprotein subunit beta/FixA family protein [Bacteroidia bacterium]MCF8447484.1 electron transfer flavoprotein subunit beta/FixA family protein [Bacteroidia bacterium]